MDLLKEILQRENKMLNIEKYKDEILDARKTGKIIGCAIGAVRKGNCNGQECNACRRCSLEWLFQEYKEPILGDAEKAYLSEIIKPFRDRVKHIYSETQPGGYSYIVICVISINPRRFIEYTYLPSFETGTMYKGMESSKGYTLEELGL